ncbi:MAG TPA: hypothetical protein VFG91_03205 [Woeseiaceae bacterium]|nr:hypothetical protein [Woeseiaceae bacterium]
MTDDGQDDMLTVGLGSAERELLQAKLGLLPDTPPPHAVWQRIERQARAEGLMRAPGHRTSFKWLSGAGLAAAVVLAVLNFEALPPQATPEATGSDRTFPTEPSYRADNRAVRVRKLHALMVESQLLEQDLRALPSEPVVVRAGTAATIAAVQDQIAAIDYRLNYAPPRLTHDETELYWRERVRLMNLLVQLRMAQAQRNAF